jgi:hypothetical protein
MPVSSARCGRREPCFYILPTVAEMAANSMRARTFPLVAPRIQRLDWYLKQSRYFDRRGQTSHPGRRLLRPLQVPASCRRGYPSELTPHLIEVSITHVEEMGTSLVGKLSQEMTTREVRKSPRRDAVRTVLRPSRDHRGTHLVGARARPPETRIYLGVCSSGGGTRTHNLRINSPNRTVLARIQQVAEVYVSAAQDYFFPHVGGLLCGLVSACSLATR